MSTPFHRAAVRLRHAHSVVVCGHIRPDGDAVGSVLGLTLALRDAGVAAVPVLADADDPPRTYDFLPGFALFMHVADLETPDVFVALDTPNFDRLGEAEQMARDAEELIVIDHHPDNSEFGDVNIVDSRSAASGQLVWRLVERLETDPSPEVAMCCYVGLMTDTGRFQFDNTTPQTFRDAAEMIEAGVNPAEASRLVYQERTAPSLALQARMMSRITLVNGGRVAYSWMDQADFDEAGALPEEAEYLPDALRQIGGVDAIALLRVADGEVRGNLRAKTGADVGAVARTLGGGGHRPAAGFTFSGNLEECLAVLLPLLPGGE